MSALKIIKDQLHAALWAMEKILDTLPEDYIEKEINSSFPNIKTILLHIWSAQTFWYNRITGNEKPTPSTKNFDGDFTALKNEVLNSFKVFVELLDNQNDDFLNKEVSYTSSNGKTYNQIHYQVLLQLSHHTAFHRGQIIAFMRQLGYTDAIPQTDLIFWYRDINN